MGETEVGEARAALANAMVSIKKEFYGRGPESAKAWLLDDMAFVSMDGGLTRNEETLLKDDKADEVRRFRLSFQETMTVPICTEVERILGRPVLSYHSQIVFHPTRTFEIFVLGDAQTGS